MGGVFKALFFLNVTPRYLDFLRFEQMLVLAVIFPNNENDDLSPNPCIGRRCEVTLSVYYERLDNLNDVLVSRN